MKNPAKLTTPEAIENQMKLEQLAMDMGISRYREALAEDGLGAVAPGKQLMKAALTPMIDAVTKWLEETGSGLASRNAASFHFLNGLDKEAIAWVTANVVLSRLQEQPKLVSMASMIALRLEQTVDLNSIAKANPRLAAKIAKRTAAMEADKNRMVFIRKGAEMVDAKLVNWDDTVRVRLGTLLIEMFCRSTGLAVVETRIMGRNTKSMYVRASESCMRWLEESHARCELLSPVRLPMVCMPRQWTTPFNGGYLTQGLRQPLVKTRNKGYLSTLKEWDMPWVYASVNALQDTEWAVNTVVYDVVRQLWENSSELGGLPSRTPMPLPTRNWAEGEEPDPAVLHAWKVDAAKTHEYNAKMTSKRVQMVQKLWAAEVMQQYGNRFHFVYNLDWRGRIYPVAPSLSPQGDDLSKAMLRFSHGVELGDDGAYSLATGLVGVLQTNPTFAKWLISPIPNEPPRPP